MANNLCFCVLMIILLILISSSTLHARNLIAPNISKDEDNATKFMPPTSVVISRIAREIFKKPIAKIHNFFPIRVNPSPNPTRLNPTLTRMVSEISRLGNTYRAKKCTYKPARLSPGGPDPHHH